MSQQIDLMQSMVGAMFLMMATTFMFNEVPHMLEYEEKRARLVDRFGSWSVGRAESVCPRQDAECVEREAGRLIYAYRRSFTG